MITLTLNRRIASGVAGAFGLLALASPAWAEWTTLPLPFDLRPTEADVCDIFDFLCVDPGQPGAAGTGGVYGLWDLDNDGQYEAAWSYAPATGPGTLKDPSAAEALGNGEVAIADTGNHRIVIVNQAGQITWNSANVTFSDGKLLRGPVDVRILPDGTPSMTDNPMLVCCKANNRVVVVKRTGQVLWAMNAGLSAPLKAERLPNGNTLIVENERVIEVNAQRQVAASWEAVWSTANFTAAERLPDGSTLVLDAGNGVLSLYGPDGSFVSSIGASGLDGLIGATDLDAIEQENGGLALLVTNPPEGVLDIFDF